MKKLKITTEGKNFSAIDLGDFDDLMNHSYIHPKLKNEVIGKVFVGEILKATGAEISFQLVPPRKEISFLHKHKNHEEIYIILKGAGEFQVDGEIFDVKEGSIVRVATEGERAWRNNSENLMIFMVIQAQQGTIDNYLTLDGYRLEKDLSWEKK